MTVIEIIDAFTFYGLDIALLSALTGITVQLLKISAFRKSKKKILTFLPFIVGVIYYAAYSAIRNLNIEIIVTDYISILEHGFSIGALSTVAYVLYEQFVRDKNVASATEGVIATLIEGYVPSDAVEKIAAEISAAIEKDVSGDGAKKTAEILEANRPEDVTESDIALLSKLIIETLAHMNKRTVG